MAFTPIIVVEGIIALEVLSQPADVIPRIALICTAASVPLATLAEIAPPFVTREEDRWRNRNTEILIEGEVVWEDVPFLRPGLNRVRSTKGKRRRKKQQRPVRGTFVPRLLRLNDFAAMPGCDRSSVSPIA